MTRVIFAGGGTAGHIEPALSVAQAWKQNHPQSEILFLGTESGLETRLVPEAGFELALIKKVTLSRSFSPSLLALPFTLIRSVLQAIRIIHSADLVVGFGGYVSASAYCAAVITRTPFVIHEANARPGIANRIGARFTRFTAVTHAIDSGSLSQSLISGLPLRADVTHAYEQAEKDWSTARNRAKESLGFASEKPLLFIFGGSQGSAAINSVIAQSYELLGEKEIQMFHGVGARNDLPSSTSYYKAVHYITDMATAYLAADIVISRSGAVTCAEVNTLGKFALFIPLPIGNGEQELNAGDLVKQSRAELVLQRDFSQEWLLSNIDRLLQASHKAPSAGSPADIAAASKIVALMEHALAGGY